MPFRNRGMGLRPVNSLKHVVDSSGLVATDVASRTDLTTAVRNPDHMQTNQVEIGSTVHSIYLRVEVKQGAVASTPANNIYMAVFKNPGAILVPPSLDMVGVSDKRKYIIHQEMLMLIPATAEAGFPRTMFNGVIRIPRGYKRNGVEDKLECILQQSDGETNQTTQFCIQCIYKEFR